MNTTTRPESMALKAAASPKPITETDLYAIGMESETGWRIMPQLCERLGFAFPPENKGEK